MKKNALILCALLIGMVSLWGCAFGNFGKPTMSSLNEESAINAFRDKTRSDILKELGNPDAVLEEADAEYWRYRMLKGFFFNYYISFGTTDVKDLILKIRDGKVAEAYVIKHGSALGIFASASDVGN